MFGRFKQRERELTILIIFIIGINLLFINKAFHIDDTTVIFAARQIIKNPFSPYSFMINWDDPKGVIQSGWTVNNPPLLYYYWAVIISLFGEKEWILHLFYFPFVLFAVVSMFFLGRRFTNNALISAAFLMATPAFLTLSHNIMLDIPFLGFCLGAMAAFIYGIDTLKPKLLIFSCVLAGFAVLTKYTGVILIPLLVIYAFLKKRAKDSVYLLIPATIFLLWCLHNIFIYRDLHVLSSIKRVSALKPQEVLNRLIGFSVFLSGVTLQPFFIVAKFLKKENIMIIWPSVLITLFMSGVIIIGNTFLSYNYFQKTILIFFIFISSSTIQFFLKLFISSLCADRDNVFLCLWFFSFLFFNLSIHYVSARYILLLTPPMILLLIRMVQENGNPLALNRFFLFCIAFSTVFSLIIASADYNFANTYRHFASQIRNKYRAITGKVWFVGHWGFQYYMDKEGYFTLSSENKNPGSEDIIVRPVIADYNNQINPTLKNSLELLDRIAYDGKIKLLNYSAHAGFYSDGWGMLPYSFSADKLESFEVYRIK